MRRKGHQYDNEQRAEIHDQYRELARKQYHRMVEMQAQRIARRIACPLISWRDVDEVVDLWSPWFGRNSEHAEKVLLGGGRSEWWAEADRWAQQPLLNFEESDLTHYFHGDRYAAGRKATRRGLSWTRGTAMSSNDAHGRVLLDPLLSSDGMHLWMWCLIKDAHYNRECRWVMERQFRQLLNQPKYAQLFSGSTAFEAMSMVFTFHVHDILEPLSEANVRKQRSLVGQKLDAQSL